MLLDPSELTWMATEAGITERERQIFALRYCEGLPDRVISEQLGITEETVRSTISHVTAALREHQWATKHGAQAAEENLNSLDAIEASPEVKEYAEGILEAHENRQSGKPGGPTRWGEDRPKGKGSKRPQKAKEAMPPLDKVRMVTVHDVLMIIRARERRM